MLSVAEDCSVEWIEQDNEGNPYEFWHSNSGICPQGLRQATQSSVRAASLQAKFHPRPGVATHLTVLFGILKHIRFRGEMFLMVRVHENVTVTWKWEKLDVGWNTVHWICLERTAYGVLYVSIMLWDSEYPTSYTLSTCNQCCTDMYVYTELLWELGQRVHPLLVIIRPLLLICCRSGSVNCLITGW
jgi:hypothetical protein